MRLFNPMIKYLIKKVPRLKAVLGNPYYFVSPKEEMIQKAMIYALHNGMAGDYLEFGVYLGRSLAHAYKFSNYYALPQKSRTFAGMRFFGFDSFRGLPGSAAKETSFADDEFSDTSLEIVKNKLKAKEVDFSRVKLVPGFFSETLTQATRDQLGISQAAIVFFDCDLYESVQPALDFVRDIVTDGTVFIFGDWYYFKANPNKGEQKAFKEWLAENPGFTASEFHKFGWQGNSFIIHKD